VAYLIFSISKKMNQRGARTIIGLALVASQVVWIVGIGLKRRRQKAKNHEQVAASTAAAQLPELEQIVRAIQQVSTSALTFVDLRQLNHWLNSEQWYFAHEQESRAVREAHAQYMNSVMNLNRIKDDAPKSIAMLIDEYCSTIEGNISEEEDFSSTNNTKFRDGVVQYRQQILERLGQIWLHGSKSTGAA
jgi:hypothetical protein